MATGIIGLVLHLIILRELVKKFINKNKNLNKGVKAPKLGLQ